jgi:hypothetical protein
MKNLIARDNLVMMQFIPIIMILFYSVYRYKFSKLSHSILGKLFAIALILYYTRIHFVYGTICCFAVILYYQMAEVEGFAMLKDDETEVKPKVKSEPPAKVDEAFETLSPTLADPIITIDQFNAAKDEFIKEKCKNGVLMYKDMPVKTEMSDHVYSEISFNGKGKCNPCDRTCDYNIVEAKIKTETELIPKFSKDVKI